MRKTFKHRIYDQIFYVSMVLAIYGSIGYFWSIIYFVGHTFQILIIASIILALAIFLIAFAFFRLQQTFTLQEQEFVWQTFGRKKRIPYYEFVEVRENLNGITLLTHDKEINISCQTDQYHELYDLLRQKIPVFQELDRETLPWKLTSAIQRDRQIIFDADQVLISGDYKESSFHPKRIQKVYLDPVSGVGYGRYHYQRYDIIIQLNNHKKIKIDDKEARRFGYPPQRVVANLHNLYPFTKMAVKISQTQQVRLLTQKADKFYQAGAYETAVSLYKQLLDIERLDPQVWQRFGDCLFELNQFEEAGKAYRQAVALDNIDALSYWRGAIAFSKSNNTLMAKLYLQEALSLDPQLRNNLHWHKSLQKFIE